MACTLLSAVNLQTPPRFAPLSHQRAVKNEVSVMKKRMRFILLLLLLLFKWDTPMNEMMPLGVFETLMSLQSKKDKSAVDFVRVRTGSQQLLVKARDLKGRRQAEQEHVAGAQRHEATTTIRQLTSLQVYTLFVAWLVKGMKGRHVDRGESVSVVHHVCQDDDSLY